MQTTIFDGVSVGSGLTIISIVSFNEHIPVSVYIIWCVPSPAALGSKVPFIVSIIPTPDQTPPGIETVRSNAVSFTQKGPAGEITGEEGA